ncbi:MAG TPA: MoaD/ThiS family protein [Caulobacteraceae bacterium]
MVKVLLFGRLADLAGWRERDFGPGPPSLSALRSLVAAGNQELAGALAGPGVQVAVDLDLVRGEAILGAGAEVAFLPPMSGG